MGRTGWIFSGCDPHRGCHPCFDLPWDRDFHLPAPLQIVQIQKDLLHLPILTRVDTKRFRIQQQMQLCMSILNFAVYTTHEFC